MQVKFSRVCADRRATRYIASSLLIEETPQAKTAKLVERFGNLSSLSGLNLSVDVERSVTVFAAQVASEVTSTAIGFCYGISNSYPGWGAIGGCGDPATVHRYHGAHPVIDRCTGCGLAPTVPTSGASAQETEADVADSAGVGCA